MDVRIKDIDLIGTVKVVMVKGEKGDVGNPTDSQVLTAVSEWLSAHPEATTTVQDGAITEAKLANDVKHMFGTKADAIVKTASNSVVSFDDGGDDMPIKSLKINIVPKQSGSGDPSLTNIRAISGWDAVDVLHTGKNLLSPNAEVVNAYVEGGGYIALSPTDRTAIIEVAPNTTYTWKWNRVAITGNDDSAINVYTEYPIPNVTEGRFLGTYMTTSGATLTFTTGANECYIGVKIGNVDKTNISETIANSQLEVGSTATDYEPYEGETITTNLPQTVYGGIVDIIEGKGQPTYHYFKPLGSESTLTDLGTYWGWVGDISQTPYGYGNNPQYGECSHFKFGTECIVGLDASSGAYFLIYKTALPNISTLAEFKTWVANQRTNGTPLEVAYRLATPTASEFTTTPTEVKTKLGSNNIWSESGTVDVEYRADTTLAYNKLLSIIASLS